MVLQKSREKRTKATKHPSSNLAQPNNEKPLRQPQRSKKSPSRSSSGTPQHQAIGAYIQNSSGYHSSTRRAYQGTPAWKPPMSPSGHVPGPPLLEPNSINSLPDRLRGDTINIGHQGPALSDLISSKLDAIISSIDAETFSGNEQELALYEDTQLRGGWGGSANREVSRGANRAVSSAIICTNYFVKANLYANSRLPPFLPLLKLDLPSYPLVCLAAQYSMRAYVKPTGKERETHVDANWRMGTKAMVIKSVPIDDMNIVIFAIRGSQTFMDWAVNLNSAPVSPTDFLDDPGNLCHSGFLSVARKMIKPVASRLRSLLQEDPSRSGCSLLITGHSAGGAIANLLYSHLMTEQVRSELSILAGCFACIHCITFGTPPISLLPLTQPPSPNHHQRKSHFLSFINEGDPVPRADKQYVRSLLDLYTSPAPIPAPSSSSLIPKPKFSLFRPGKPSPAPNMVTARMWKVPPGTLSNAGKLVVLRAGPNNGDSGTGGSLSTSDDDVRAELTTDEQLRDVVFGDPMMHVMKLYCRRVEVLATKAVTSLIWG